LIEKLMKISIQFLIPILGSILFVVLYIIATLYYPGGSNLDSQAVGFHWDTNYWCDLTSTIAKNGEPNSAQPIALTAMIILAASLSVFWLVAPKIFPTLRKLYIFIPIFGIGAMIASCFIFTHFHDLMMNIGSIMGFAAIVILLFGLFTFHFYKLFWGAIGCLILIGINNFIYYTHYLIDYLPIVQKLSFCFILVWMSSYCWVGYQKTNTIR